MRRDVGKMMTEGSSAWLMDLVHGMYDHPGLVKELHQMLTVARRHGLRTGRNNRQIAAVLHPSDPFYYREGPSLLPAQVSMFKQFEMERMGVGYDDLTLDDLEFLSPEQTAQYRFWVFPSAAHLTDRQVETIRRHCCRNGNHVLWTHGVGVVGNKGLDMDRMAEITGLRCGLTMEPGELSITIDTGCGHPLVQGLRPSLAYGTHGDLSPDQIKHHAALEMYPSSQEGFQVAPRFYIEDGQGSLGRLNDDVLAGRVGLAVRNMGDWVSVVSAAPLAPKGLLRNIAREAGCHVYTDFLGQTFHCENYLGLFFHADGPCRIRLPRPATVTDICTEAVLAKKASEVTVQAEIDKALLLHWE
jgi:hypothetical protein